MKIYENVMSIEKAGKYLVLEFYRNSNPLDNYFIEPPDNVFLVKRKSNIDDSYFYDVYKDNKLHCSAMGKEMIKDFFTNL